MSEADGRGLEDPFLVLGLGPGASALEIERAGQKLLAMLEIGVEAARTYETPWGPAPRDADAVRRALADLRDPARRLVLELLARPAGEVEAEVDLGWPEAERVLGWGAPQW